MRAAAVALALAGCGRVGFDATGDGGGVGDGSIMHIDAAPIRKTLRLDKLAPAAPLSDFPLLVVLDDTRIDRTKLAADASDLRFYDADGHVLAHEIDTLGSPGGAPLLAWVRMPVIKGLTTTLDVEYGAPPRATSSIIVWGDPYVAVWHFGSDFTQDAKGTNPLASTGALPAPGMIGSGIALGGTQYMTLANTSAITPAAYTVSGWALLSSLPAGFVDLIAREAGTNGDDDIYLGVAVTQTVATCEHASSEYDAVGGAPIAGTWQYYVAVATDTGLTVYLDGASVGTVAVPGALQSDANPIFIGADSNTGGTIAQNDFFIGQLDEIRIQQTARDANWISYENAAMRDQVITYP